jgi:hypothetical protein
MRPKTSKKPNVMRVSLDKLLADLGQGADTNDEWTRANDERGNIAETIGVDVATWSTREKSTKVQMRDARRQRRAVEAVTRLPEPGEYLHIITGQEFAGFDLLPAMLTLTQARRFEALTLTTLGFSKLNLEAIAAMVRSGKVRPAGLRILCSDFFRRADRDIWRTGAEQAHRLGYGFRSTRNHTKLILAEVGRRHFVVESSANLRSCANLEQFTITQSKQLFDFHAGWITQVWQTAED